MSVNARKGYNVIYLEFYFTIHSTWGIDTSFSAFLWLQTLLSRAFFRMVKSAVNRTGCQRWFRAQKCHSPPHQEPKAGDACDGHHEKQHRNAGDEDVGKALNGFWGEKWIRVRRRNGEFFMVNHRCTNKTFTAELLRSDLIKAAFLHPKYFGFRTFLSPEQPPYFFKYLREVWFFYCFLYSVTFWVKQLRWVFESTAYLWLPQLFHWHLSCGVPLGILASRALLPQLQRSSLINTADGFFKKWLKKL